MWEMSSMIRTISIEKNNTRNEIYVSPCLFLYHDYEHNKGVVIEFILVMLLYLVWFRSLFLSGWFYMNRRSAWSERHSSDLTLISPAIILFCVRLLNRLFFSRFRSPRPQTWEAVNLERIIVLVNHDFYYSDSNVLHASIFQKKTGEDFNNGIQRDVLCLIISWTICVLGYWIERAVSVSYLPGNIFGIIPYLPRLYLKHSMEFFRGDLEQLDKISRRTIRGRVKLVSVTGWKAWRNGST